MLITDSPSRGILLRVLPAGLYAGRGSRVFERSFVVARQMWLIFLSGVVEPVFYLFAFQIGFGALVGEVEGPGGQQMSYVAFVAPALLVASAMNGAVLDATFNVFFKLKFARTYDAMLSTPVGPMDVALGEIGWAVFRGGCYAGRFSA